MTVNLGGSGYFNFGNSGDVAAWDWEMETYFYDDGSASTVVMCYMELWPGAQWQSLHLSI